MFKVMVQGKTREELIDQLVQFSAMLGAQAEVVQSASAQTQVPTEPPPAEGKRGRGRPKKAEEPTAEETNPITNPPQEVPSQPAFDDPFASASESPKESAKTYTPDQVRAALMEFAKARTGDAPDAGAKRVYALIQQFGYKNVKEIKPEHYAQIMAGTGLA